jgi:hypothetical protein
MEREGRDGIKRKLKGMEVEGMEAPPDTASPSYGLRERRAELDF